MKDTDKEKKYKKKYSKTPMGRALNLLGTYNIEDIKHNRGKGNLTAKWIVENIFTQPCAHCGKTGWEVIGCNRLDNSKPHTMDNVEPCCRECNLKLYNQPRIKRVYQYTLDGELVAIWPSAYEAGKELNIDRGSIRKCCIGKCKKAGGFIWSYTLIE